MSSLIRPFLPRLTLQSLPFRPLQSLPFRPLQPRPLSTTPIPQKKAGQKKVNKPTQLKKGTKPRKGTNPARLTPEDESRIRNLKTNLFAKAPPPLRMARSRALRHWTVHRAWLIHQRRVREARDKEMMRMHQGMSAACEELRQTAGPGTRSVGWLYRVAMEKKGVYASGSLPLDYARLQTDWPAKEAWNHDWKESGR